MKVCEGTTQDYVPSQKKNEKGSGNNHRPVSDLLAKSRISVIASGSDQVRYTAVAFVILKRHLAIFETTFVNLTRIVA